MWRAEVPIGEWLKLPLGQRAHLFFTCHVESRKLYKGTPLEEDVVVVRPRPETPPACLRPFLK